MGHLSPGILIIKYRTRERGRSLASRKCRTRERGGHLSLGIMVINIKCRTRARERGGGRLLLETMIIRYRTRKTRLFQSWHLADNCYSHRISGNSS